MNFAIAPDSTWREATREARGWYAKVTPWIWLVWLVWLLGPLLFMKEGAGAHLWRWALPTLLSLPFFLVAYLGAHFCSRRHIPWFALALLGVALATTPWNPFAQTYVIYACAVAAASGQPRRSGALVIGIVIVYTIQWFWLDYPWVSMLNAWILCPIIAGLIITELVQRRHRAELRLSMDEVRRLAASAERERIGRDLHDLLGHTLSMVALKSELAGRLVERQPQAARREIIDVANVARDALAQVRSAVSGIRAAALVSELASARLLLETDGVQMEYWVDGEDLPPAVETCLALVLREAVTNIQRHARANRVEISVIAGIERVVMRIRDDGRGGLNTRGNGLTGMRERVAACGGELAIESPRGRGTSIEVMLPLPQEVPVVDPPIRDNVVPLVQPSAGQA